MPQLNPSDFAPQLIWLAITFIALYILMARVALPRIADAIETRRNHIQRDLDEAERLKAGTESAIAAYEQSLAEARRKAHDMIRESREALSAEIASERAKADKELAERLAEAEARIRAEKDAALGRAGEAAAEAAGAIVTALTGLEAAPAEVAQALDQASHREG